MRCTLERPDLQILIIEICKIFIEFGIVPWIEHIHGKDNIIPDALSRNKPNPCNSSNKYPLKIDVKPSLQSAANLCKNIKVKRSLLIMDDI